MCLRDVDGCDRETIGALISSLDSEDVDEHGDAAALDAALRALARICARSTLETSPSRLPVVYK